MFIANLPLFAALWTAALWAVTALGSLDPSPGGPMVAVLLLLPWLHVATAVGLLMLLIRDIKNRTAQVLMLLQLGLGMLRPDTAAVGLVSEPEQPSATVSLSTWNLARLGTGQQNKEWRCNQDDAQRAAAATLQQNNTDVFVLLEISAARLDHLKRELKLTCEQTDYFGTGDSQESGLAVCVRQDSQWQITRERTLELPEEWTYVFAELSTREDTPTVINVLGIHLKPLGITTDKLSPVLKSPPKQWAHGLTPLLQEMSTSAQIQWDQADRIREQVETGFKDPTVIAGDFNATPDSAIHYRFRRSFTDAWEQGGWGIGATREVGWLPLRIDYIYTTNDVTTLGVDTFDCFCNPSQRCSDHRGVSSQLSIPTVDTR